jgi:phage terminase large subunit
LNVELTLPEAYECLLEPMRYKIFYGGRASGGTWNIARFLIMKCLEGKKVLCTREFQKSIKDSVHAVLAGQIKILGLDGYFRILQHSIESTTGGLFIFAGLRHNPTEIKSLEGIDYAWIEEAQNTSQESLDVLIPTIRKEGSELIFKFNTGSEQDPVYQAFVKNKPDNAVVKYLTYRDNPFFPDVLKTEMEYCKEHNYDKYLHVWEGKPKTVSELSVFRGKYRVDSIEPPEDTQYYYGLDFGFSAHPSALVECYVEDDTLYITREKYGLHIDIDRLPAWCLEITGRGRVYADNSRPETISYMKQRGVNVQGCKKWPGCVEDGIERLRGFRNVVIDEQCKNTIYEFENYSYEADRLTGKPTPKLKKEHDHCVDALRYALQDVIRPARGESQAVKIYM